MGDDRTMTNETKKCGTAVTRAVNSPRFVRFCAADGNLSNCSSQSPRRRDSGVR